MKITSTISIACCVNFKFHKATPVFVPKNYASTQKVISFIDNIVVAA